MKKSAIGGSNQQSMFGAIDLTRALYAITGTALPEGHTLDGEDVSATLLGQSTKSRQQPLFFRRPPDRPGNDAKWGMGDNPDLAARQGPWKFLINYDGSHAELYHIIDDATESKNLIQQHPEVAHELKKALLAWNASLPADAGDPKFPKAKNPPKK
jgi:uncharacterized sulfatase